MAAFVGGSMGAGERAAIDAHIDDCADCRRLVAHLAATSLPQRRSAIAAATTPPARDPAAPHFEPGTRIGRYVLHGVLGRGAMGVVYLGHDPQLDRPVAVKLLRGTWPGGSGARLAREARAMARTAHPNLLPIFDVGTDGGEVFIAMERVEGQTLRNWITARERPWRVVLDTMIAAGRGLAAAHAAGVVHRDFKPDNVLVGDDGRVLVMDFGLARQLSSGDQSVESPNAEPGVDLPDTSRVTHSGTVVGTPVYMAPEQLRGEVADERSDQFAFCVSVYEALSGKRPFAADRWQDLAASIERGAAPLPRRLPGWLRTAVMRGLQPLAQHRHRSMTELLSALGGRRRWVSLAALGVGAALVASSAVSWAVFFTPPTAACDRGAAEIQSVWTPSQRGQARANVPDGPFAAEAQTRIDAGFEDYKRDWARVREAVCDPSVPVVERERRLACLRRQLAEVEALSEVLATADNRALEHGARAVQSLAPAQRCESAYGSAVPPHPARADAVARAQRQLATADAERAAGRFERAVDTATQVAGEAQAIEYPPLQARAGVALGLALIEAGRVDEAQDALTEAYWTATRGGLDELAEQAAVHLVHVVGSLANDPDEGHRWFKHAAAFRARLGNPPELQARAAHNLGTLFHAAGQYDEARRAYQEAAELHRAVMGAGGGLELAKTLSNLGSTANRQGDQALAIELHREALEIRRTRLGPLHPDLAQSMIQLGNAFNRAGSRESAAEQLSAALAILEGALPSDHVRIAEAMHNLAAVLVRQGELDRAERLLERALEIRRAQLGPDDPGVAAILGNLAGVDLRRGRWDLATRRLEQSAAIQERALGPQHPELGTTLINLGSALVARQKHAAAHEVYERTLEIFVDALGPEHPYVAKVLDNLGGTAEELGAFASAADYYRRSLAIRRKLDPDDPLIARSLAGLGSTLERNGDHAEAHATFTEALAISQASVAHPGIQPTIRWMLARTTWRRGQHAKARSLATTARAELEAAGPRYGELVADIDGWLATHR